MRTLANSKALAAVLLLLFCIAWFGTLGTRALVPTDEGRYAEMAREMVSTNDWITPRLNGIRYFEKPPLQTWMNAATFKVFGLGEWQARLWTGLCGFFTIWLMAYTGRRVFGRSVGITAAAVLGSSLFWIAGSHINSLDMGLSAMMTLALCGMLLGQRNEANPRQRRSGMLICWAGMALAVLSKGLMGVVLPGAVLVLYTLLARDWTVWKRLYLGPGLTLFLLICAPWFILVAIANPSFLHFFFIHEHLQRFTSTVHHRAGPWHYFFPLLVAGIMPWLGILLQSLWDARRSDSGGFQPKLMLLVWAGFIFFFFSISGSKLPAYILPIFPALALLIGNYLENRATASTRSIVIPAALLALLCAGGLPFVGKIAGLARDDFSAPLYENYAVWVGAAGVVGLLGSLACLLLARRYRQQAILLLAATSFCASLLLMQGHDPMGRYAAGTNYVAAIKAELTANTPLYAVGKYEQVLPFYLERTTTLVAHQDELEFGLGLEPQLWIPQLETFARIWTADSMAGKKSVAIFAPWMYEHFVKAALPMRVIAKDPRRVIVTNDPAVVLPELAPAAPAASVIAPAVPAAAALPASSPASPGNTGATPAPGSTSPTPTAAPAAAHAIAPARPATAVTPATGAGARP